MYFLKIFQSMLKFKLNKSQFFTFYFLFKKIQKMVNFFMFSLFSVFFNVTFPKKKLFFNNNFFYFLFFFLPFYCEKKYRFQFTDCIVLTEYEFFLDFFNDLKVCNRLMAFIKKFKFCFLC